MCNTFCKDLIKMNLKFTIGLILFFVFLVIRTTPLFNYDILFIIMVPSFFLSMLLIGHSAYVWTSTRKIFVDMFHILFISLVWSLMFILVLVSTNDMAGILPYHISAIRIGMISGVLISLCVIVIVLGRTGELFESVKQND
mgnify:CR=1 FL=1